MPAPLRLHPDRFLPTDPARRDIARQLYALAAPLPIVSPHGHTDPAWFAINDCFTDASGLLLTPDHYLLRMLYSQGIGLAALGIHDTDGRDVVAAPRASWRCFASHYHLLRGTPSRLWLDHVFAAVFGMTVRLDAETADTYFDTIGAALATDAFRPRNLLDRFHIECIATTEGALDPLPHHQALRAAGWGHRVLTTFRPDDVVDPDRSEFATNLAGLAHLTGEATNRWPGFLAALRARRAVFRAMGATATDHGHPTARTADLPARQCQQLLDVCLRGTATPAEKEHFRAQVLTEMAGMSLDDGLVMQIHAGSQRNHNAQLFARYGRDRGADIPAPTNYVHALAPLLDRYGNEPALQIILFTLDESAYSRELAPLAGHYPALKLGPPWWFHDSVEGMLRFRRQTTETTGFYNTVGFNDDTRALLSIPARHDLARRVDSAYLASLVADHRLQEDEAAELIVELSYTLAKQAYRLPDASGPAHQDRIVS